MEIHRGGAASWGAASWTLIGWLGAPCYFCFVYQCVGYSHISQAKLFCRVLAVHTRGGLVPGRAAVHSRLARFLSTLELALPSVLVYSDVSPMVCVRFQCYLEGVKAKLAKQFFLLTSAHKIPP